MSLLRRIACLVLFACIYTPLPAAAQSNPFVARTIATLDNPWAMVFLPDGQALITEKPGRIRVLSLFGDVGSPLAGVPAVANSGQGGLLDIAISPFFARDKFVYISYAEPAANGRSNLAVARATFANDRFGAFTVIWRNQPTTGGHFGGRLAMRTSHELYITTGDRQQFTPAQDTKSTLGKIVRLTLEGAPMTGNPFIGNPAYAPEIFSLGHRNPYGLAFDPVTRQLWEHEMGPQGGDELNLVSKGRDYGWPRASNGSNYDGSDIPDHRPGDGFVAPKRSWNPSISPAGMIFYTGMMFPEWHNRILMGALSGQSLLSVTIVGKGATAEERYPMGQRIREVEQAPDGSVYLLTDGPGGKLLRLTRN